MSNELDKAMAEFLANGGVIQQVAYKESGRVEGAGASSFWGAKKSVSTPPPAKIETDKDEE